MQFSQNFVSVTLTGSYMEDILVTKHARKVGFTAIYSESISTDSDSPFVSLSLF